jgi:Subtilase family
MSDVPVFDSVPWNERVKFDPAGRFAYRPNTVFMRNSTVDQAFVEGLLRPGEGPIDVDLIDVDEPTKIFRGIRVKEDTHSPKPSFDVIRVVAHLRAMGIDAQPDHVLFAHEMTCCCCGPHPATWFDPWLITNPLHANPLHANPLHANPLYANPLHANPFRASAADPNGPTRSSARPAEQPDWYTASTSTVPLGGSTSGAVTDMPHVVVLDTGLAGSPDLPNFLGPASNQVVAPNVDVPDANGDNWLDPVAGHGTFIAGIIRRIAPGCAIEVRKVLGPQGDGSESAIVGAINAIADLNPPPAFLSLSFGGYVWDQAPMLSAAVLHAQKSGIVVVASAGNDGTCRLSYPAATPGVVSVGAIGPDGPAWFSNYGDWVRACAPGMDVVSSFFASFDGNEVPSGGRHRPLSVMCDLERHIFLGAGRSRRTRPGNDPFRMHADRSR